MRQAHRLGENMPDSSRGQTRPEAWFFEPRGLEAYVPALASLRSVYWDRLDADLQVLLEIADYLGLDATLAMQEESLGALRALLPTELWHGCAALQPSLTGGQWTSARVIQSIAQAIHK